MKTESKRGLCRFELKLLGYGNYYYIERIAELTTALAKKPRRIQIDMVGEGDVPADTALLIRSILNQRAARTQVTTNARSSLQNGSVIAGSFVTTRGYSFAGRMFRRTPTPNRKKSGMRTT